MNLICDYSDVTTPFNYPLLFGADIDSSKNYFRLFKGKLSNLTVTAKYNYLEIPITLPLPYNGTSESKIRLKESCVVSDAANA